METNWIQVTEALPEHYRDVLTFSSWGQQVAYLHEEGEWYINIADAPNARIDTPTYWADLPNDPVRAI